MDASHRGIGQSVAEFFTGFLPAVALQLVVHPLNLLCGDEADLLVAKAAVDLRRVPAVTADGARTERDLGVVLELTLEPFAERHAAVLS